MKFKETLMILAPVAWINAAISRAARDAHYARGADRCTALDKEGLILMNKVSSDFRLQGFETASIPARFCEYA